MLADLPPEGQALVTVTVFLAVAYFILYPAMKPRTLKQMGLYDLGVTGSILVLNGLLFWGTGTRFSLLLFDTNWAVFSLVMTVVIETPLLLWYMRRNDITMD